MAATKMYPIPADQMFKSNFDLTQTTRRPSENLFNVLNHRSTESANSNSYEIIRQKRPNSEDSTISRNTELFSTLESSTSLPSLISLNNNNNDSKSSNKIESSQIKTIHQTHHYLTPSQRYRLHKNQHQTRNLIINNDTTTWGNDDHIENINQDFLWNIPCTKTTYGLDKQDKLPTVTMIPGVTQNYQNDDQYMATMCNSLSSTYISETKRKSQVQMDKRLKSSDHLPLEWKQLDNLGLEDIKCVSTEKVQMMSPGRPQWLPPKSSLEIRQHKNQINQQMDSMYHDQLKRNQWLENYKLNIKQKYTMLSTNDNKRIDLTLILKIVKEMPLPAELRFNIISNCIKYDKIENYNDICHKLSQIQNFPPDKELEINKLIQNNIIRNIFNPQINSLIPYLLKLRSISNQGICRGDDVIIYHLLNMRMPPEQIFIMLQLIQSMIMNHINDYEMLSKKQSIKRRGWENCEEDSKFSNWWNVMERIDNSHLFLWIFDMLILLQDTNNNKNKNSKCIKFMISLPLLIIKDYHFGWNTLRTLHDAKGYKILFPGDDSTDLLHKNYNFMSKLISLSKSL
ncbi:hypothetical protein MOSE0_I06260 [Monosporozyma servazzii]